MNQTIHPYYPLDLVLPNYIVNAKDTLTLVVLFFSTLLFALVPGLYLIYNKSYLKHGNKLNFVWFLACGFIHLFFEGYFVVNHATLASHTTLFGELWKEYAKCDSRYLTSDSFVLWMEFITAFAWGPLSFLTCYFIYNDSLVQHIPIIIVSLGQLYGDILYYMTTLFEGAPHGRPEPYYFYFYFVFMNAFWIIIPLFNLYLSYSTISNRLAKVEENKHKKQ